MLYLSQERMHALAKLLIIVIFFVLQLIIFKDRLKFAVCAPHNSRLAIAIVLLFYLLWAPLTLSRRLQHLWPICCSRFAYDVNFGNGLPLSIGVEICVCVVTIVVLSLDLVHPRASKQ